MIHRMRVQELCMSRGETFKEENFETCKVQANAEISLRQRLLDGKSAPETRPEQLRLPSQVKTSEASERLRRETSMARA